jgi:hypothetical protein
MKAFRKRQHARSIEIGVRRKHRSHARKFVSIARTQPAGRAKVFIRTKFHDALFFPSTPAVLRARTSVHDCAFRLRTGGDEIRNDLPMPLDGDTAKGRSLEHCAQAILQFRRIDHVHG